MKVYELTLSNLDDCVYAISVVDKPAIESNFMLFSVEDNKQFFALNQDLQEITGAVLIPNKEILRKKDGEFYNVFMSESTIKQASIKFFENGYQNNTTLQHEKGINDTTYFESWIVEDVNNDKANALGFKDLVKGTWFATLKVNNKDIWNSIKEGNFNGFSIEGLFTQNLVEMSKIENKKENKFMSLINKFKTFLAEFEIETATQAEEIKVNFMDAKLEDGTLIRIDDATLEVSVIAEDGSLSILADGTYTLESGETLIVLDGKKVMEVEDVIEEEVKVEEVKTESKNLDFEIVELQTVISDLNKKYELEKQLSDKFASQILELEAKIVELEKQPAIEKTPIFTEPKKDMTKAEIVLNNLKKFKENNK